MADLMKAWRLYGFNDIRLDEVPIPQLKPGWALVKVRVVQLSITETMWLRGEPTIGIEAVRRMVKEQAPLQRYGHEFCGQVVAIGDGVRRVKVGDRVSTSAVSPCYQCEVCLSGRRDQCRKGQTLGLHYPGCLAEYALVPDDILAPLNDSIDDHEGALVQPLSSCVKDAENVELGDTAVVLGQGCMGLFTMQAARVSGATTVIGVDVKGPMLELSRKLGADCTINAALEDPVEKVLDLTRGVGADIVFEAAGGSPREGLSGTRTLEQAINMVRDGGKIVVIANIGGSALVDVQTLRQKSVTLIFPHMVNHKCLDHTVGLLSSKRVKVRPMISHILHGIEKAPEAFEITANKSKYAATGPAQIVVSV